MENYPSKYFQDAYESANNEFLGFGGEDLPFGAEDLPMDGDFYMDDDNFNAEGPKSAPTSQPYVIVIENTTTAAVSNVTILDAAQRQNNFAVSGISLTYGLTNITYQQFLSSIAAGRSFKVGLTRLVGSSTSTSNAESQVLTTTTVTTKDINGNEITKPLIPQKDSYQQINNQTDLWYPYMVDELTRIVFDSILGSTMLKVYLYPAAKINKFDQLKQRGSTSRYGNPKLDKILTAR